MTAGSTKSFHLWREDDNGQRFLIGEFPDRATAEKRLAELTRALHKQIYWIDERRSGQPR